MSVPQVRALQAGMVNCSSWGFATSSYLPPLLPGRNKQQWFWGGQLTALTSQNHSACTYNAKLLELLDHHKSGIIRLYCTVFEFKWLDEMRSGDVMIFPSGSLLLPETRTLHLGSALCRVGLYILKRTTRSEYCIIKRNLPPPPVMPNTEFQSLVSTNADPTISSQKGIQYVYIHVNLTQKLICR